LLTLKNIKFYVALFRTKVACALKWQWPSHAKFVNFWHSTVPVDSAHTTSVNEQQ